MGFSEQKGKVTVDSTDKKNPTKRDMTYEKYEISADTNLTDVLGDFVGKKVKVWDSETSSVKEVEVTEELSTEETEVEGEAVQVIKSGTVSITQLLADAFGRFSYTAGVAIQKGLFNNSPEKAESAVVKQLMSIINNPDTPSAQRDRARRTLAVLQS